MTRAAFAATLLAVAAVSVAPAASGAGLEEVILNVTWSTNVSTGVECSWGLDSHSKIRAGLNFVLDLSGPTAVFGLLGRAVYLYNLLPQSRLSPYAGLGVTGTLGFIETWPPPPLGEWLRPLLIPEAPLGIRCAVTDRLSLLGELRIGFVWPGGKLVVAPIAVTLGLGYSLR
ncbi:MAG: hypothetical protein NUW06_05415 [Candidatus Acetothermia bacterium]|jgi:hypothetical protein|nr:hypothetical protein [Candidatus Acetothermia bacterium]MDH7505582.1 hypothetical protein [Candidatus Acetothermia bacterium]